MMYKPQGSSDTFMLDIPEDDLEISFCPLSL